MILVDWRKNIIKLISKLIGRIDTEKLVERGLKLGENVNIQNGAIIDSSHCFLISIDDDCTIAPTAYILAHDASTYSHLGYTKIGLVNIGKRTFIGAGSVILPGVSIGHDVIVGAGSVVSKDIASGVIVAGNPAVVVGETNSYARKHQELMKKRPVYESDGWRIGYGITEENKRLMREALKDGIGYVK